MFLNVTKQLFGLKNVLLKTSKAQDFSKASLVVVLS